MDTERAWLLSIFLSLFSFSIQNHSSSMAWSTFRGEKQKNSTSRFSLWPDRCGISMEWGLSVSGASFQRFAHRSPPCCDEVFRLSHIVPPTTHSEWQSKNKTFSPILICFASGWRFFIFQSFHLRLANLLSSIFFIFYSFKLVYSRFFSHFCFASRKLVTSFLYPVIMFLLI